MKHLNPTPDITRLTRTLLSLNARAQTLTEIPQNSGAKTAACVADQEQGVDAVSAKANAARATELARTQVDELKGLVDMNLSRRTPDWRLASKLGKAMAAAVRQWVEMRVAEARPPAPRHEPITSRLDALEDRIYSGVKASRLSFVIRFIAGIEKRFGVAQAKTRLGTLSHNLLGQKLLGGLMTYAKVKGIIRKLEDAVDRPETAIIVKVREAKPRHDRPQFTWDVSPHEHYGWRHQHNNKGYDVRDTSVYWLQRHSAKLRREIYNQQHDIKPTRGSSRADIWDHHPEKPFAPPQGADRFDEVWPPIDLKRVVEDRKHKTCDFVDVFANDQPEEAPEIPVRPEAILHGNVRGLRVLRRNSRVTGPGASGHSLKIESENPNAKLHPD